MCRKAAIVAEFRIRGHFGTTFLAGPRFRMAHKLPANAAFPVLRVHEPSLEITDMVRRAALDERPDAHREEAYKPPRSGFSEKHMLGTRMIEYLEHFGPMLIVTGRVPQEFSQSNPLVQI